MGNLPLGAWQGAVIVVVACLIQNIMQGHDTNIIHVGTWIILGALSGMGVAKLWKRRQR